MVLDTWVPDGEPMWADYIGPIGNTHGPGESGLELGNMDMGPIWNISGLTGHSMGLGNTMWDPFGFRYMGARWGAHLG